MPNATAAPTPLKADSRTVDVAAFRLSLRPRRAVHRLARASSRPLSSLASHTTLARVVLAVPPGTIHAASKRAVVSAVASSARRSFTRSIVARSRGETAPSPPIALIRPITHVG